MDNLGKDYTWRDVLALFGIGALVAHGAAILALAWVLSMPLPGVAHAAPPPVGSEDYKLLMPYKEWVTSQHDKLGRWCCDLGDGRPVDARIVNGDHWEAHITHEHFPDEPEAWLPVPEDKIVRAGNPTGTPIVWLWGGKVQCFAPPGGV